MYAAVCNELIARSNHYLSAQKLPLMILAKEHYQKAASALPAPRPEEPESSSTMNDITLGLSRLNSDASFASTITSGKRPRPFSYGSEIDSEVTRPSPLRIRKAVRFSGPPPSFILPRSAPTSRRNSLQLDDNTDVWLRLRALERFNNHLVSLSESIQDHLKAVDSQIISISEAQANWKLPIPFKLHAGAPQEDINLVEKRARIERLRANGWKRERYCGARYEDLCQRALAEL
ncbi:MAG: hypothetical protein M1819_002843 [Sarea resinae]|nr:MAG: hypothetical protein M1819_002843 [Sarea resinae]